MSSFAEEKTQLRNDVFKMGMQVIDMLSFSMEILEHPEEKDRDSMKARYKKVQAQQYRNEEKVAKIAAAYTSEEKEIRDIIAAVRISVHFERIASRSLHIANIREPESLKDLKEDFHKLKKMIGQCEATEKVSLGWSLKRHGNKKL